MKRCRRVRCGRRRQNRSFSSASHADVSGTVSFEHLRRCAAHHSTAGGRPGQRWRSGWYVQYSMYSTLRTQYSGDVLRVPLLLLSPLNSYGKIINEKNDKFVSESAAEAPNFKRGCHLPLDVTSTVSWSYSWCKEFTKKLDWSKWSPAPPRTLAAPAYVMPSGQTWLNYDIWALKRGGWGQWCWRVGESGEVSKAWRAAAWGPKRGWGSWGTAASPSHQLGAWGAL